MGSAGPHNPLLAIISRVRVLMMFYLQITVHIDIFINPKDGCVVVVLGSDLSAIFDSPRGCADRKTL